MNSPWPVPKIASASTAGGRLVGAPSSTAKRSASAATQVSMPATVSKRGPSRSLSAPPSGATGAEQSRDDGKPQARGKRPV